jgi:hypothetical protein
MMESNLQAWMQQYADRFRNPQNLVAQQPPAMGAQPQQNLTAQAAPAMAAPAAAPTAPAAPAAPGMPNGVTEDPAGDGMDADSFESHFKKQPAEEQDKQQVGSIDRAYGEMSKQLGQRPTTKLSRKEKGMLIMEFGLQLMSQSAAARHGGDLGGAVGDAGLNTMKSYQGLKAGKQAEGQQWDADQVNLRASRNKEVTAATKDYRVGQREERLDKVAETRAENEERRLGQTDERLRNLETYRDRQMDDREKRTEGLLDETGDSGGGKGGKPTAAIQNIEYLVKNGMSRETATRVVHKQIKDPKKAFEEIYKSARQRYANESDAKAEANRVVEILYGEGAVESAQEPLIPTEGGGGGSYEDQLRSWANESGISKAEKEARVRHMNRELHPGVAR